MTQPSVIFAIYGVVFLIGALFGARAGSRISLVMGTGTAVVLFGCAWSAAAHPRWAALTALILGIILTVTFARRLKRTKKWMPSGALALVSLTLAVFSIVILSG